jgi:hypothetical protein
MRVKRTKGLTAHLTSAEYAALEVLAGAQPISTWAREQLLAINARRAIEETVIGEIAALRTIVLNLEFAFIRGETLSEEDVQKLIDRADRDRVRKARARLAAGQEGSPL